MTNITENYVLFRPKGKRLHSSCSDGNCYLDLPIEIENDRDSLPFDVLHWCVEAWPWEGRASLAIRMYMCHEVFLNCHVSIHQTPQR